MARPIWPMAPSCWQPRHSFSLGKHMSSSAIECFINDWRKWSFEMSIIKTIRLSCPRPTFTCGSLTRWTRTIWLFEVERSIIFSVWLILFFRSATYSEKELSWACDPDNNFRRSVSHIPHNLQAPVGQPIRQIFVGWWPEQQTRRGSSIKVRRNAKMEWTTEQEWQLPLPELVAPGTPGQNTAKSNHFESEQ